MSAPFNVSQAEYERLLAIQTEQGGKKPEVKSGAEVADDALQFGKKVVINYFIAAGIVFMVSFAAAMLWMMPRMAALDTQTRQIRAQVEEGMKPLPYPEITRVGQCDGSEAAATH